MAVVVAVAAKGAPVANKLKLDDGTTTGAQLSNIILILVTYL